MTIGETVGTNNFEIAQGSTWTEDWDFNTGFDISSGYTARLTIREKLDTDVVLELTDSAGITLGSSIPNFVPIMTAVQTTLFTFDTALYWTEIVKTSTGVVTPFLHGTITLIKEVPASV